MAGWNPNCLNRSHLDQLCAAAGARAQCHSRDRHVEVGGDGLQDRDVGSALHRRCGNPQLELAAGPLRFRSRRAGMHANGDHHPHGYFTYEGAHQALGRGTDGDRTAGRTRRTNPLWQVRMGQDREAPKDFAGTMSLPLMPPQREAAPKIRNQWMHVVADGRCDSY